MFSTQQPRQFGALSRTTTRSLDRCLHNFYYVRVFLTKPNCLKLSISSQNTVGSRACVSLGRGCLIGVSISHGCEPSAAANIYLPNFRDLSPFLIPPPPLWVQGLDPKLFVTIATNPHLRNLVWETLTWGCDWLVNISEPEIYPYDIQLPPPKSWEAVM